MTPTMRHCESAETIIAIRKNIQQDQDQTVPEQSARHFLLCIAGTEQASDHIEESADEFPAKE